MRVRTAESHVSMGQEAFFSLHGTQGVADSVWGLGAGRDDAAVLRAAFAHLAERYADDGRVWLKGALEAAGLMRANDVDAWREVPEAGKLFLKEVAWFFGCLRVWDGSQESPAPLLALPVQSLLLAGYLGVAYVTKASQGFYRAFVSAALAAASGVNALRCDGLGLPSPRHTASSCASPPTRALRPGALCPFAA
ncbi:hypothetical protein FB451DRAFT_1570490 [Mycena latifolia]|nr:hypothetical protein FB451DRAFT_1570490 [Mycena latifolia]